MYARALPEVGCIFMSISRDLDRLLSGKNLRDFVDFIDLESGSEN